MLLLTSRRSGPAIASTEVRPSSSAAATSEASTSAAAATTAATSSASLAAVLVPEVTSAEASLASAPPPAAPAAAVHVPTVQGHRLQPARQVLVRLHDQLHQVLRQVAVLVVKEGRGETEVAHTAGTSDPGAGIGVKDWQNRISDKQSRCKSDKSKWQKHKHFHHI